MNKLSPGNLLVAAALFGIAAAAITGSDLPNFQKLLKKAKNNW